MVEDVSRGSQRGVVPTSAELENGERGVGLVDADALRRARARPASCAAHRSSWRPRRPATRRAARAREPVTPSSPREPVSETTSSISARCDAADPRRPWRTSSQLRKLSASGSAASAPVARGELRPRVGEVVPGPVVEDVDRREDGVEVHDMDVAAGDRLEPCLILGRAGHGRAQHRHRRACSPVKPRGDAGDAAARSGPAMSQRSMTVERARRRSCAVWALRRGGHRRAPRRRRRHRRRPPARCRRPRCRGARRPAAPRARGRSRRRCGSAPRSMPRRRRCSAAESARPGAIEDLARPAGP